jgi:deoxyribodipyrimidine photo-lyase
MSPVAIQDARIQRLNDDDPRDADYVLYWMQQAQRAEDNHALEYAVRRANERRSRLLVAFGLMDDYPGANLRHYAFMLEGLQETQRTCAGRGIKMVIRRGHPAMVALRLARGASLVVCDRGYLRHQRQWRERVAKEAGCELVQVETDVVVPVDVASGKAEYAARTIRPKIHKQLDTFLVGLRTTPLARDSLALSVDGIDLSDLGAVLEKLKVDRTVAPVSHLWQGGTTRAKRRLRRFLDARFRGYDDDRNQPQKDGVSHLAKYLHFGQISPLYIALQARRAAPRSDRESFLEELIVRRELACNHVRFRRDYDAFRGLPNWAIKTLEKHADDQREHVYTRRELEEAKTHDPYWNAAMREMRHTGYMHNYMRMYWGKKILEWTNTPRHAYRVALDLNNKYFLDGRDCASFANVGWIFGLHDRPWAERKIFGTVRYMSAAGLERKCDIEAYVKKVERLVAQSE